MSVCADCRVRRFSVPEFAHGHRFETLDKGMVQQFRSSTVASSSWRHKTLICKYFKNGRLLSCCIVDYVLPEDVQHLFESVVSHRLVLTAEAKIEQKEIKEVLDLVLRNVKTPDIKK